MGTNGQTDGPRNEGRKEGRKEGRNGWKDKNLLHQQVTFKKNPPCVSATWQRWHSHLWFIYLAGDCPQQWFWQGDKKNGGEKAKEEDSVDSEVRKRPSFTGLRSWRLSSVTFYLTPRLLASMLECWRCGGTCCLSRACKPVDNCQCVATTNTHTEQGRAFNWENKLLI